MRWDDLLRRADEDQAPPAGFGTSLPSSLPFPSSLRTHPDDRNNGSRSSRAHRCTTRTRDGASPPPHGIDFTAPTDFRSQGYVVVAIDSRQPPIDGLNALRLAPHLCINSSKTTAVGALQEISQLDPLKPLRGLDGSLPFKRFASPRTDRLTDYCSLAG